MRRRRGNLAAPAWALNISARLLSLMGSELRVDTRLGQGSTFSFELILGLPPLPQGGHLAQYRHQPGKRVLWVDVTGQSVAWYRTVFSLWSVELDHATSLDDAADWLSRHAYQAVFVDALACCQASEASLQALLTRRGQARLCVQMGPTDVLPPLLESPQANADLLVKPVSPQDLNRALTGQAEALRPIGAVARLEGLHLLGGGRQRRQPPGGLGHAGGAGRPRDPGREWDRGAGTSAGRRGV